MFSHSIAKILSRNTITSSYFSGCYSADTIPPKSHRKFPYCLVVNLDCSGWEGSHWVSIFVATPQIVEYYDSLGDWPPLSPYILDFLQEFDTIEYNSAPIQSSQSSNCGKHAIYFLIHRCSGTIRSINEMVVHFKMHDKNKNPDTIVNWFVRKLMEF